MSFTEVEIVRCNYAQTLQSRRNHFVQWGQPLGFEEQGWVDRFTLLEKGEWAQDDRYVTWALVRRGSLRSTDLLAHCETFRRSSTIKDSKSTMREVVSYGVASVFTPTDHRGKGYARQLLQLLHYVIAPHAILPPFPATWGPKPDIGPMDAAFSILFSGIGEKYYASCRQGEGDSSKAGWIRQPITSRTWKITDVACDSSNQGEWEWRGARDIADLESEAADDIKKAVAEGKENCFAVLPEWELLQLHAARSAVSPAGRNVDNRSYGLVLPAIGDAATRPFVTFTYPESSSDTPTLRITYMRQPIPFDAIVSAAEKAGCSHVSMWGGRSGWDSQLPALDTEFEMPCYVVYGEDSNDWEWIEPELYTWC